MPTYDNKWVKYKNMMQNQNRLDSLLSRVKLSAKSSI